MHVSEVPEEMRSILNSLEEFTKSSATLDFDSA
jgi:hypothetical protein